MVAQSDLDWSIAFPHILIVLKPAQMIAIGVAQNVHLITQAQRQPHCTQESSLSITQLADCAESHFIAHRGLLAKEKSKLQSTE